jgi:hypothetical protein
MFLRRRSGVARLHWSESVKDITLNLEKRYLARSATRVPDLRRYLQGANLAVALINWWW